MNKTYYKAFCAMGFALLFMGCGGRVANPVAATYDYDGQLTCTHHVGEVENLRKRLVELAGERGASVDNNVGTFLLLGPIHGVMFFDGNESEKEEIAAILERNKTLATLMTQKECPNVPEFEMPTEVKDADEAEGA